MHDALAPCIAVHAVPSVPDIGIAWGPISNKNIVGGHVSAMGSCRTPPLPPAGPPSAPCPPPQPEALEESCGRYNKTIPKGAGGERRAAASGGACAHAAKWHTFDLNLRGESCAKMKVVCYYGPLSTRGSRTSRGPLARLDLISPPPELAPAVL
ncbi:hypothetical protein EVAR_51639_1 [Eumeta japonica]|uniref:Uncharacterized protein n=1 Tax=Eumeta variegata TaxID=151549 RepID=A0A4C1YCY1_EUMVA|nr:hypothetical protein EVAR_51639_1 [Eumeta japonica]